MLEAFGEFNAAHAQLHLDEANIINQNQDDVLASGDALADSVEEAGLETAGLLNQKLGMQNDLRKMGWNDADIAAMRTNLGYDLSEQDMALNNDQNLIDKKQENLSQKKMNMSRFHVGFLKLCMTKWLRFAMLWKL